MIFLLPRQRLFYKSGYSGGSQTIFKRCEYLQKPHSKDLSLVAWAAKGMAEGAATAAVAGPLPQKQKDTNLKPTVLWWCSNFTLLIPVLIL